MSATFRATRLISVSAFFVLGICCRHSDRETERAHVQRMVRELDSEVLVVKYGDTFSEYRDVERAAVGDGLVRATAPIVFLEVTASSGTHSSNLLVEGIDPARDPRMARVVGILQRAEWVARVEIGKLLAPTDARMPGIIVGAGRSAALSVKSGDTLRVVPTAEMLAGVSTKITPRAKVLRVIGVFRTGVSNYDDKLAFVSVKSAQQLMGGDDSVTAVRVFLKPGADTAVAAKALGMRFIAPYKVLGLAERFPGLF